MLLGQVLFNGLAQKYLKDIGRYPATKKDESKGVEEVKPVSKEDRQRHIVIFILTAFVVFFWAGFEQAGSSLSLYTDKYINRVVLGFEIPTAWFQSVNPLFIVALAPLFALFWTSKLGKQLSTPIKMGLGMILLGIGFFFMLAAVAERGGNVDDVNIKASLVWLVMTYLLHTIGELCLSPVGLSVVTKLSHPKFASLMMGVWLLASFLANIIGGFVASVVESLGASTIFATIAGFVMGLGLIMILLNKKILKLMHGIR
jgi:POT family proton-dependent oligopeptide transporter